MISLYWYSQIIGSGRGLRRAVEALSLLDDTIHLSLRGAWRESFRNELLALAEEQGVRDRLHHLPPSTSRAARRARRTARHGNGPKAGPHP